MNHQTDILEEQQVLASLVNSYITPTIVTFCIIVFGLEKFPEVKNVVWDWVVSLLVMQFIQSAIILYITFVSYRRETEGESSFNKCMPITHYVLAIILFVVSPTIIIIAYFSLLASTVETKALFPYFTFNFILTVILALWFFIYLLDVFERLKRENASARRTFAGGRKENQVAPEEEDVLKLTNSEKN